MLRSVVPPLVEVAVTMITFYEIIKIKIERSNQSMRGH